MTRLHRLALVFDTVSNSAKASHYPVLVAIYNMDMRMKECSLSNAVSLPSLDAV